MAEQKPSLEGETCFTGDHNNKKSAKRFVEGRKFDREDAESLTDAEQLEIEAHYDAQRSH
jgi:hypothetical protein